jgi:glycosyltransferase involved in cell wall biosynthesis
VFERLDRRRIHLELIVLGPRTTESAAFEAAGIELQHLDHKHQIFARVRAARADQLFLSGPKSQIWGSLAARWTGLPASHYFNHMMSVRQIGFWTYVAQRAAIRRRDRAIAVSSVGRTWLARQYGLTAARIEVIHPAISVAHFEGAGATVASGGPQIAMVGRVAFAEKGQHLMLRAMTGILSRHPTAVLTVIGDGADLPALRDLVASAGLEQSVRLLGQRRDVATLIRAATLVVVPSMVPEGFPLVTLEAAAAGRPCVAFASGGMVESVRDGETGILVPTGDVDALTKAILSLLDDAELSRRMGEAGNRFAQQFRIERQVEAISGHFESLSRSPAA